MSRELWEKCVRTDYSNPSVRQWMDKYTPTLVQNEMERDDLAALYTAINIIEGLKLKYKLTENTHERTQH